MAEAWKKDPEFQAAYDELETDFALLRELLAARRRAGLTQARYMEYLEALKDPSHPDHQQMVEWRGPSFDPERFDPAAINRIVPETSTGIDAGLLDNNVKLANLVNLPIRYPAYRQ